MQNSRVVDMKLGLLTRLGAGFIGVCALGSALFTFTFLISEGLDGFGIALFFASLFGVYLFGFMSIKGGVPRVFKWLE